MIGENSVLEFFFLIHRITENVQSKHFRSIGYNSKIDAQKVLQKQDETFIHRSFYPQNFQVAKIDFGNFEISKHKGFIFCQKSNPRKNITRISRTKRKTKGRLLSFLNI